jgi:hypothetical protein
LTNDGEIGRPLNNLITRTPEFEHFTAERSERWTLPMAAAWFIWRDLAAVDDQWKIVTGNWAPAFDPPIYILSHHRRQPGTLTCVFQQARFACGARPYMRLQDIRDLPSTETRDPYERLRVALQTGRLRATVVEESLEEGGLTERDLGMDDWFDFDALADPANDAPYHFLSDPARYAVLVRREEAIRLETELSVAEAERPVWKLEQALGWIAYRRDRSFRSLGRIDLHPPTFFGRSYKDFVEPPPLATLTKALLSGEVHAYVDGVALTRAECITWLSEKDGLWSKEDRVFVPDELRETWQRKAESSAKIAEKKKGEALAELIEILKEGKRRKIRVLRGDAEGWMQQRYKIEGKAFSKVWREARKHPDVERDVGGCPTEAQRKASAALFESHPITLTRNPQK